ncbi:MAG TPA: hypothetical protein ENG51_15520 [Deltaproteobacteria bacterium]|nr:hypothetical protein [Deltaproteobacteria bacterium]
MEKGTCFSSIEIKKLTELAKLIKKKYGVNVWFVEILGRRWSYIAGQRVEDSSIFSPECVSISERFGVVSDHWKQVPPKIREQIKSLLDDMAREYEQK